MIPTVLDCEKWDLTFDVPSTDDEPFDANGSRFTAVVRATTGGPVIATLTTVDGSLVVAGGAIPRVRIVAPLADRTWRAPGRTKVMADVMRHLGPDDSAPTAFVRLEFWVEPATQSAGIARSGPAVVLKPFQPGGVTTVPVLRGPQGPTAPVGGGGGGGSGAAVFVQSTPSASWAIPHALGRYPSVSVYDATGAELLADVAVTPTTVSVVFANPTAGTAILT